MTMADWHIEARKLFRELSGIAGADAAREIAHGVPLRSDASDEEKAAWVRHVCGELERGFDAAAIRAVKTACHCDEQGKLPEMKQWLGRLYRESRSMAEFVDRVNEHGAGWYLEGGALYTKFLDCECSMLRGVESLPTATWCQCAIGYTENLFRHVFGYEVRSELLQTIKTGAPFCLIRIERTGTF